MTRKIVPETQFFHARLDGGSLPKDTPPSTVASFTFTIEDDGAFSFISNQLVRISNCHTQYRSQLLLDDVLLEEVAFDADYDVGPPYPPPQPDWKTLGILTSHGVTAGTHTVTLAYGLPSDVTWPSGCPNDLIVYGGIGFALLEVVTTATSDE